MKIRKTFFLFLILFGCLCSAVPVSVSGNSDISGEIQVFSNVPEADMEKYLNAFSKKYPDIQVDYRCLTDYESEMKTLLQNKTYGDVLFIPGFIQESQYSTYFSILGQYPLLSDKYNYLDISARSGDSIYGIPSYAYTSGILYNKDVFYYAGISEAPKRIDDFLSALSAIQDRTDAIPFYTNYSSPWALQYWEHFPFIDMTGNPDYRWNMFLYEKDPYLEGSTHYQVYELLYEIVERGLSEDNPLASDWEKSKSMLNNGEIASIVIGSWAISQFKNAGSNGDSLAFMPFPHEINGMQYMTISTDYNYAISRYCQYPEAARAYIDFMLDESGYALDHETLSIVKTDPYPESYGDMENVILLTTSQAKSDAYSIRKKLSINLNMEDGTEAQRIIEAAKGYRQETFSDIAKDWNTRWESARPANMNVKEREEVPALLDSVISNTYSVNFSQTELEYIKEKNTLNIGYCTNIAPFQYEKDGIFTGLSLDICTVIEQNTGLSFHYVPFQNTEELILALQQGQIDIIAGLDATIDYNQELKYSKEYSSQMNVIVQNKSVDLSAPDAVAYASIRGEQNSYSAIAQTEATSVHTYDSFAEAISAVNNASADYTVMNYYTADYYVEELESENISILPLSDLSKICFAYAPNVDTRLISICNKCIYGIPDETIQLHLRDYMKPTEKDITLERFIRSNPFTSLMVVSGVFLLVVAAILLVFLEKSKSAKKQALDVKRYEILASMVDEYIVEYDYSTNVCYFDEKLQHKFGVEKNIVLSSLEHDGNIGIVLQAYQTALSDGKDSTDLFLLTDTDGTENWYKLLFHIIYAKDNTPRTVIGKICNMQKEVEEKQQIVDKAQRDALTGLYNRKGFDRRWEETSKHPQNLPLTVIVLDADDFKGVNDTLGHAGGDAVLQLIADSLTELFPDNSIICRYGGDEFMLCIYGRDSHTVQTGLEQLVHMLDREYVFQNKSRKISISVGAYQTSVPADFEALFQEADKSLYQTKEKGKNGFVLRTDNP